MSHSRDLDTLLKEQQLLVCIGPGGVGKTTLAAAMGLRAASLGQRTLVLTIDPAKRLADALGLDGLDDEIREIKTESLTQAGHVIPGKLYAAMFDNAVSMDSLMRRVAPDPVTRDKILSNRVYRAMAGSLARSHAYLAMERLYEVMQSEAYDLVILDTPPARNALDILDAPGKLASFLEEGVVKWFVRSKDAKGLRARLMQNSGAAALKLFSAIVGKGFLQEIVAFFEAFYSLRHGFRERAVGIQKIMGEDSSSFVLVSSVDQTHLQDARVLAESVMERGITLETVVFNRSYQPLSPDPQVRICTLKKKTGADCLQSLKEQGVDLTAIPAGSEAMLERFSELRHDAAQENATGLAASRSFLAAVATKSAPLYVGRIDDEIADLPGLYDLLAYFSPSTS